MANYEDLKKMAKGAIETIADASVEAYKIAEEKARILAKKTRLNAEITREKALIRRLKLEIGHKYYELHKDDPEEELKADCESINDSVARIKASRQGLEDLKNAAPSCDCGCDAEVECDAETECGTEATDTSERTECEAEAGECSVNVEGATEAE